MVDRGTPPAVGMRRNVPLRRSLLIRLLATSLLVAVCSIATTAWLAVQSTTRAIEQAQGQAVSADAQIYDRLIGYAATHSTWDSVGSVVADLARQTGLHITLTTSQRRTLAESGSVTEPLPVNPSAVINPLQTDPILQPGNADRIDSRAVGPYLLTPEEREKLNDIATTAQDCLWRLGFTAEIVESASGRPALKAPVGGDSAAAMTRCKAPGPGNPVMPTEKRALVQLQSLVNDCLRRQNLPEVEMTTLSTWLREFSNGDRPSDQQAQSCVDANRREQLRPYVAPAALLFVRSPGGTPQTAFNLSRGNLGRIAGVTAVVLTITVVVTVLVAARLVRPLRVLTAAAQNPAELNVRVPVKTRDEIGLLSAAFNDLSERRERAEEQRKALVGDVAHELRTPLTNIRSWLEAAEDGLATAASDPVLNSALLREALQLQHIIDDLQDLAAADAGRLRLHPESTRICELLDQVVTAHEGSAQAAGVILRTRTIGDPELTADPVRLRQAVGNLVSNAIRYTPSGGSVAVQAKASNGHVVVKVTDSGVGIAAEDLTHVFNRFWRADKSRTRQTGGSGLGLAIVQQIAQAHGGAVDVSSTIGRGSTFTLRIPASPAQS
jgi:two-component system, OmpR family, sensor histidine kinase BaeS